MDEEPCKCKNNVLTVDTSLIYEYLSMLHASSYLVFSCLIGVSHYIHLLEIFC